MSARPTLAGDYTLLQDFVCKEASVRVISLETATEQVDAHTHEHSAQIYIALEGEVLVDCDGHQEILEPYRLFYVPRGATHGVRAAYGPAVVANISVPPLQPDDQVRVLTS
ncbi:MAG: cupin domain-containing protein [Dehalococcoidia bacterium]